MNPRGVPLVERAIADLVAAGRPLVERDVKLAGAGATEVDLLVWDADDAGRLRPEAVVEVKTRPGRRPGELAQLARYAAAVGAPTAYVYDGSWHRADDRFDELEPVQILDRGLIPATRPVVVDDVALLRRLILRGGPRRSQFRQMAKHAGRVDDWLLPTLHRLADDLGQFGQALPGSQASVPLRPDPSVLFDVVDEIVTAASVPRLGPWTTSIDIASALLELTGLRAGDNILVAWAGTGTVTRAAARRIARANRDWTLEDVGNNAIVEGIEPNEVAASLARAAAAFAPSPIRIHTADPLTRKTASHRFIVAVPPVGLRLDEQRQFPGVGMVTDGDVAAIASVSSRLGPGGRAVLHTGRSWLWRSGAAARLRAWLLRERRVTALIGLPPGTFLTSGIDSVIVVIDNAPSGRTFVAELAADWAEQLRPGGPCLEAYRDHAEDRR